MQATLAAAAQLLQAGGRGPQRIGLGQALGSALQAGQGAYEKGTTSAVQNLLLGQKLQEGARLNEYQKALLGTPTTAAPAPSAAMQAMAAPVDQVGLGPSPQRAELMTQIEAKAPQSADEKRFAELMRKADIANAYNRPEDADKYLNQAYKIKPPEEFSTTPNFGMSATGTPISYVLSKAGGMRLLNVQRSPEFNYTDTGAFISVRDKATNKEIEQIPKSMTPGEKASNWIAQQNLEFRSSVLVWTKRHLPVVQQRSEKPQKALHTYPKCLVVLPCQSWALLDKSKVFLALQQKRNQLLPDLPSAWN